MKELKSNRWYHCHQQRKRYLLGLVVSLSGLFSAVGGLGKAGDAVAVATPH